MSREDAPDTKARRAALRADFTPAQLERATRGLTIAAYAMAFRAGATSYRSDDISLDERVARYMSYGTKRRAHEYAFLDGNTWDDSDPETIIRDRIEHPENH